MKKCMLLLIMPAFLLALSGCGIPGETISYAEPAAEFVMETEYGIAPVNQVEILMKEGKGKQEAQVVAKELGAEIIGEISFIQLYQLQTQGQIAADLVELVARAAAHPDVAAAGANQMLFSEIVIKGSPLPELADPLYNEGTNGAGYGMINLENAWKIVRASGVALSAVRVGVADEPRYEGSDETGSSNFVGDTTKETAKDGDGNVIDGGYNHGTFVSHIIGADGNNSGVTGVAANLKDKLTVENANIFSGPKYIPSSPDPNDPTKIVYEGTTYTHTTLVSLKKLADNGCKVINCSFGGYSEAGSTFSQEVYTQFFNQMHKDHPDVVFVASAGNGANKGKTAGQVETHFPGGLPVPNLITVGALNPDGTRADFSSFQAGSGEVTVSACGVDLPVGVDADGNVIKSSGTSFAAPQATAAIAILQAVNPNLTAEQIKAIISDTASQGVSGETASTPIPAGMGAGVLNLEEAVLKALNDKRIAEGGEPWTKETLLAMSSLELTATGGAQNNELWEYTVVAEMAAVGESETNVGIEVSGEHTLSGATTQRLDSAGSVSWQVSIPKPGNYLKVTRSDTGGGAWLILAAEDFSGTYTMTADMGEFGVQTSTVEIVFSGDTATMTADDTTITFTVSGNSITCHYDTEPWQEGTKLYFGQKGDLTITFSAENDTVTGNGAFSGYLTWDGGRSNDFTITYTLTKIS